ncbi:MAG TPA: branched-chain amino acid ABC transporter substrate-binding protein [Paucimonas sp.]|nr:branched-chain amino acid ABC transporter substrate-binding protein [Paucimonas sp.]
MTAQMQFIRLGRTLLTLGALASLAACSRQVDVKIGVVAPMSGSLAQYGKDIAQGAQIAVDELNQERFVIDGKRANFQLVVEDDKADKEEGKKAAQRLVDAGVSAVFGHFNSGVSIPAAPIYAKAGIPQLSVSTNPEYTRMGLNTAFRLTADDIQQGAALGKLASEKLRAKSIFLVDDKTKFGIGLIEEVKKVLDGKGIKPPHESVDPTQAKETDYAALVQKIVDSGADLVLYAGDETAGLPLLKNLRRAVSSAKFVVADAMCDQSTIKNAEGFADNNYYCTIAGVPPSWLSTGIAFTELYKAKYNGMPGAYSTLAYDGIHVFAQAMQEAASPKPAAFLPLMKKTAFDGKVQGTVEFDSKGDIKDGTVVIFQSIGGKLTEQRGML